MSKFVAVLFCLFVCANAFAWKEVSGGNGVGGTLLDSSANDESIRLHGSRLMAIFKAGFSLQIARFPFLEDIAFKYMAGPHAKAWYTEGRQLRPECKNQILIDVPQEIWACQNDVEVRINVDQWYAMKDFERSRLLLHEILTAMRGDTDDRFQAVIPAVLTLTNGTSPFVARFELMRVGFPTLLFYNEIDRAVELLALFVDQTCEATTAEQATLVAEKIFASRTGSSPREVSEMLLTQAGATAATDMIEKNQFGRKLCARKPDSAKLRDSLFKSWYADWVIARREEI